MISEKPFEIEFYTVGEGWLFLKLIHNETEFILSPDGFMHDSMLDLVQTIASLWKGRLDEVVIEFHSVPTFYEFHFISEANDIILRIDEYPDGFHQIISKRKIAFEARDNREHLCLMIWRAIRKFQSQFSPELYTARWKHPFPFEQVESLTKLIKERQE
jgi:hypothetical protein